MTKTPPELVKAIAREIKDIMYGLTDFYHEYYEAAQAAIDIIAEYEAPVTVAQRQAREKLAAIKKRVDYWRPKGGRLTVDGNEVFELIEQAGLELPL